MTLQELAVQAGAVGGGVAATGTLVAWLFREKIAGFVDRRVERKLAPLEQEVKSMDNRVSHIEREVTVTGETMKNLAESVKDHMTRQTVSLSAISTEITAQGKQVAEMRGELNAQRD